MSSSLATSAADQGDHVAQDQHGALARWQQLDRRQEGERHRLPVHRHRLRVWLIRGQLVEQRVRVRLNPRHRGYRWPGTAR